MKLTSEEIKRLIFEADTGETNPKTDEEKAAANGTEGGTEGDIDDDPEETPTDADKTHGKKPPENTGESGDKSAGDKSAEEKSGDIKSELTADGWEVSNTDGITYFLKESENSNFIYILNFSKLFSESKFLTKIRELILEEDTTNITCILELVNTDTGIAYGPFTLETANNYDKIKKAIAEKANEVVDSNWSEEFADKEFANVSEMTKKLARAYNKEKTNDSADSENEGKPTETDKENSDNKEEQSADGEKQEEHSEKYIVDKINEAFSKLTENEQNAFEVIYGDKLINKIQGK
jgi:hypothetical protein